MLNKIATVLVVLVGVAYAESTAESLRDLITESLEANLEIQAKGIENCANKCDKAFNRFAYEIATAGLTETYEFRACVIGCEQCTSDLAQADVNNGNCFRTCKNKGWGAMGILKGVIEPDKACMGGCIIQTCQVICADGTVEPQTAANKNLFYPNGGCSIKTERYSQSFEYVPFDSPNNGQGGSEDVAVCCANALSLCEYVGDQTSANYRQLLANTGRFCSSFVESQDRPSICAFYRTPRNCGQAAGSP
jgi:hypothetical protein